VIISLYLGNFHLCQYLYSDNINEWWKLNLTIREVITSLSFYLVLLNISNKKVRVLISIGLGISASNVIDRVYFDTTQYEWNDLLTIGFIIIIALYEYRNEQRREDRAKAN
jgi:hypothetical protein